MAHGPAHDAAEHVATAFIRRQHAIGDQESAGAQVIGDHPVRSLALTFRIDPGELGDRFDQRAE